MEQVFEFEVHDIEFSIEAPNSLLDATDFATVCGELFYDLEDCEFEEAMRWHRSNEGLFSINDDPENPTVNPPLWIEWECHDGQITITGAFVPREKLN